MSFFALQETSPHNSDVFPSKERVEDHIPSSAEIIDHHGTSATRRTMPPTPVPRKEIHIPPTDLSNCFLLAGLGVLLSVCEKRCGDLLFATVFSAKLLSEQPFFRVQPWTSSTSMRRFLVLLYCWVFLLMSSSSTSY